MGIGVAPAVNGELGTRGKREFPQIDRRQSGNDPRKTVGDVSIRKRPRRSARVDCDMDQLITDTHPVGSCGWDSSSWLAGWLVVAGFSPGLGDIAGDNRIDLRGVCGSRRSSDRYCCRGRSGVGLRHSRRHCDYILSMAGCGRSGGPRHQGSLATPHSIRSKHSVVAPLLPRGRWGGRRRHRRSLN